MIISTPAPNSEERLGEMLARTYHESQDRPVFAIREILEARDDA